MEIIIGTKFKKPLAKGKFANCEVIDIVKRYSTANKKEVGIEYWAKSSNYFFGKPFEVAKNTILRWKN